jgi:hypothetical protein
VATSIAPFLLFPLVALSLYRRFRQNFGRQLVRPRRMMLRAALMAVVTLGFAVLMFVLPGLGSAAIGGVALGAALGLVGLGLTAFESGPQGRYYTPNPYLGLALSSVLLARIGYRYFVLMPGGQPLAGAPQPFGSPLTIAMFGALIGYYLCYSVGVLVRTRPGGVVPSTLTGSGDPGR